MSDDANPENESAPNIHTTKEKKEFLYRLSSTMVDKYILDSEKHERIVSTLDQLEERVAKAEGQDSRWKV